MDLSLRSIRKNIAALSVFAIIASMLVVTGVANAAAVDYNDIDGGEWYEADVNWGLDNGVLDDTQVEFRAPDNASRAEFFTMVARGAAIPEVACDELAFPDLDADHWGCPYITALAQEGVVAGDDSNAVVPGAVRPDHNINRAEAAKVVVEAYGLTGTRLGSDVFTDVEAGVWYDAYMGTANENCVFRGVNNGNTVEPGREINRAESVTVVQRGANPTTDCAVVVEAGALTVSLDGSTPDTVSIPQNGANIPYSVFQFSASNDEDINVEQVVITREGLGLPGDFTNLKLYVDGVQKGSEKTISTSTNTATFNLSSDPIEVPAGGSVLVEVRADMSGVSGSENKLCIAMPEDVLGYGADSAGEVSVGGTFEVCGNHMTTTSAVVGTLNYTVTQPSTAEMNIGDADVSMTKVKLDMTVEDVEVTRMTFKQSGSASEEDFANVSLWMSGTMYADNPTWDGDYVTFDLSENPIAIAKGNSKTVELHVDVVGGLSSTAAFDIYRDWHIEGTGQVYGYGVNVAEVGGVTPTARNIIGGNVAFSLSSNNPITGDVKKGADDHEFTKFNISTGGDGITVRKLTLTVNGTDFNDIDDVKVWAKNAADVWTVVAGPNDVTVGALPQTIAFTDTFEINAGTTQEFMITADIANVATATDVYDIDVADVTVAGNVDLEYLADGNTVAAADITGGLLNGNVMTVNTPQVTVSLAATPGPKSYVRNTTDKDIVAFDFKASSADDIKLTSLTVSCADTSEVVDAADNDGDGFIDEVSSCHTAFSTMYLYEKDGANLTKIDTMARSMSDAGTTDTVTFSMNYTIDAGSTARLLVRSNLQSGAVGDDYLFNVVAAGDVTAEDSDSSTATVLGNPAFALPQNVITVAPNGLFSSQAVTDASLQARIVASEAIGEPVLKVKFSADQLEAWEVQKVGFILDGWCDANFDGAADLCADKDVTRLYIDYLDANGDPQSVDGTISNGLVSFTGLDIYVPAGGTQTVDISLNMGEVAVGGATAGDRVQLTFDGSVAGAVFEAVGVSSAVPATLPVISTTSKELRLAKSFPVVTSNDNVSTAMSTNSTLYSVTVAADDAGPIAVKQLCFDVVNGAGGAYTAASAKIYREGESTDLVTSGEVTLTEGALCGATGTGVLVKWLSAGVGGEDEIAAGTSKTYVLKGAVTGAATGDKVTTTLIGDNTASVNQGVVTTAAVYTLGGVAEPFVWSDLSASPHLADEVAGASADYLDGYLVDGVSSVTAHEVKF